MSKERKLFNILGDPLRWFAGLNLTGDILMIASGADFGSGFRQAAGITGLAAYGVGLSGKNRSRATMGLIALAGGCYVLSGLGLPLPGLTEASDMRITESIAGAFISAGAIANIKDKGHLSRIFFMTGTCMFLASAVESMVQSGRPDWWVIGATALFLTGNYFAPAIVTARQQARDAAQPPAPDQHP